jgi:hypothetical protein
MWLQVQYLVYSPSAGDYVIICSNICTSSPQNDISKLQKLKIQSMHDFVMELFYKTTYKLLARLRNAAISFQLSDERRFSRTSSKLETLHGSKSWSNANFHVTNQRHKRPLCFIHNNRHILLLRSTPHTRQPPPTQEMALGRVWVCNEIHVKKKVLTPPRPWY